MAAPKPSTVTRISSQLHPILVTVDTFHPGLCHEGIENVTVTRIAFLSDALPMAVDPTKEHDDDDDDDDVEADDEDDDHHETPRVPNREPHHTTGAEELRADPNPEPDHTTGGGEGVPGTNHWGGGGAGGRTGII